jgi:hypothetical protein
MMTIDVIVECPVQALFSQFESFSKHFLFILSKTPSLVFFQSFRALKPKERKVQQIELDEYLRPVKYDKKGKKIN